MGLATPSDTPNRKKAPMPRVGIARGTPEELVEVVVDGPGVARAIGRLHRNQQLREEALQDPREDPTRIP